MSAGKLVLFKINAVAMKLLGLPCLGLDCAGDQCDHSFRAGVVHIQHPPEISLLLQLGYLTGVGFYFNDLRVAGRQLVLDLVYRVFCNAIAQLEQKRVVLF